MPETGIKVNEELENYLKNTILEKETVENRNKICDFYVELSARETLTITRRLFEEKLYLVHEFRISQLVEKEKNLLICGEAGSEKHSRLNGLILFFPEPALRKKRNTSLFM